MNTFIITQLYMKEYIHDLNFYLLFIYVSEFDVGAAGVFLAKVLHLLPITIQHKYFIRRIISYLKLKNRVKYNIQIVYKAI